MTRQEFIDSVVNFYDLIDFCEAEDLSCCSGIYDAESRDTFIRDEVYDMASYRYQSWVEIRDRLNDYDDDYFDFWILSDYGWSPLDEEDFAEKKNEVLELMDDHGWDDDNEPEDAEVFEPEPAEESSEQEEEILDTMSIEDLFAQCEPMSFNRRIEDKKPPEQHAAALENIQILF